MADLPNLPDSKRLRLEFAHDHQGRRIQKKVYHWSAENPGSWSMDSDSRFVCDRWNLVSVVRSDLSLQTSFLWGSDLSGTLRDAGGVGGLVATAQTAGEGAPCHHFTCFDGNGNVEALINPESRSVSARYEYSPYGHQLRATGPMANINPFRYSTKFTDVESQLLYYGFRYYSPETGRWLGKDPIGEVELVNLYGAFRNDPANKFDADGRFFDMLPWQRTSALKLRMPFVRQVLC